MYVRGRVGDHPDGRGVLAAGLGEDKLLLFLSGSVSALFGIVMFANPGDGALVLLALIAAFLLVLGVTQLVFAIGGKRLVERRLQRVFKRPEPQPSS